MDTDRPHYRTSTTTTTAAAAAASSELFICLTSRRSSSTSMKLSKSLLSPARAARDGPPTLSSSLSRRLRPNGSLKSGHASPFFPTPGGKKRGCGFDNPEPSSPKVTCIGQVRVKSKKKKKKKQPHPSRSLSNRRSSAAGDLSFRKIEPPPPPPQEGLPQHRNQRWVHLPISICEALRSFGAEFSCLFPCRSSCFSGNEEREKSEKRSEHGCGAVLARWLVAEREIELVVGDGDGDEDDEERRVSIRASRRHVFEDFEVKDDRIELKGQTSETAAVGICVPPPNALLLMRCRSDPMKMAALANRFNDDIDVDDDENDKHDVVVGDVEVEEIKEQVLELEEKGDELKEGGGEEVESNMSSFEALLDQENAEQSDDCCVDQVKERPLSLTEPNEGQINNEENKEEDEEESESLSVVLKENDEEHEQHEETESSSVVLNENDEENAEHEETKSSSVVLNENDEEHEEIEPNVVLNNAEDEEEDEEEAAEKEKEPLLPECLLLMMCEPKLSMEVSRETWVCSTDFTKWLPERPRRAAAKEPVMKRRRSVDSKAKPTAEQQQQPRSSCSLPAAAAMASMIERKLAACEPFVLTRCKSEPMRTAAGKLAPESCFWKSAVRKLEPHAMGVGAAGVGF
ncbi:hypothetical protein AAHA92_30209 [Salvia divinorum]|uniref:Uncharacterized protein n=1 Tax=Salvia divinorum TaxID=28513 RepID=A0ABD1G0U8_SALDI